MKTAYKFIGLAMLMVFSCGLANGDDDKSISQKCGAEFQKVAACLTYATGKATAPSKECCDAAEDIKDEDPVCLCYIIEQIHKGSSPELKSMGIQEDKLLQLPSACKLTNASISNCPKRTFGKATSGFGERSRSRLNHRTTVSCSRHGRDCIKLLNIPSTSPDYAIFTNASTASKTPAATPSGASSSSSPDTTKDSSNGFKNGPQLSIFGTIVAAAVVAVCSSVIPRGTTSVLM